MLYLVSGSFRGNARGKELVGLSQVMAPARMAAMGIHLQHFEADVTELQGATCERFLSMKSKEADGSFMPSVFWLKIYGGAWHRFFIDAWVLFWDEREEYENESDFDFVLFDLGSEHGLDGIKIVSVIMEQTPEVADFESCLTLLFADGRACIIQYSEEPRRVDLSIADAFI